MILVTQEKCFLDNKSCYNLKSWERNCGNCSPTHWWDFLCVFIENQLSCWYIVLACIFKTLSPSSLPQSSPPSSFPMPILSSFFSFHAFSFIPLSLPLPFSPSFLHSFLFSFLSSSPPSLISFQYIFKCLGFNAISL